MKTKHIARLYKNAADVFEVIGHRRKPLFTKSMSPVRNENSGTKVDQILRTS